MERPRTARDIMVSEKLVTVGPEQHVFDGIHTLLHHNVTGAPVIGEGRKYLGVLSEKCCLSVLALSARLRADRGEAAESLLARDIMVSKLVTFGPQTDVYEAIDVLLRRRISGAPVVDDEGRLLGVFSERYGMRSLIQAALEGTPGAPVKEMMNTDMGRTVADDAGLFSIAQIFTSTHYRRLPVIANGALVGQISRRDVLRADHHLAEAFQSDRELLDLSSEITRSENRDQPSHGGLPTTEVKAFMDTNARTIAPDADLLSIAQIFLSTNYRRLPVVDGERLVGQVSRRDVLQAANQLTTVSRQPERALLYLSAVQEPGEQAPID